MSINRGQIIKVLLHDLSGDPYNISNLQSVVTTTTSDYDDSETWLVDYLLIDTTASDLTATLPSDITGWNEGKTVLLFNSGTNNIIIDPNGNTIDGITDNFIIGPDGYVQLVKIGTGLESTYNSYFSKQFVGSDVSGANCWLDASLLTGTDGSTVATFPDQINSNDFTGTGGIPTLQTNEQNGKNVLRFDIDTLDAGNVELYSNTTGFYVCMVCKPTSTEDMAIFAKYRGDNYGVDGRQFYIGQGDNAIYETLTSSLKSTNAVLMNVNEFQIYEMSWVPGEKFKIYINGNLVGTSDRAVTSISSYVSDMFLGGNSDEDVGYYVGDLAEVIFSNVGAQTDDDREALRNNLLIKWGLYNQQTSGIRPLWNYDLPSTTLSPIYSSHVELGNTTLLARRLDIFKEYDLLYTDVINKRVGIGTRTPSFDLDVYSADSGAGVLRANGYEGVLLQADSQGDKYFMADDTPGNRGVFIGDIDSVYSNAVFETDIENSFFSFMNGNVGVGVSDPDESIETTGRIHLGQTTAPGTTADKIYNVSGTLYWNGIDLTKGGIETYTTVANAEASGGADNDLCYVVETDTIYRYEASGSAYTDDNEFVLSTNDGGDTRWLAVAGQYVVNELKLFDVLEMKNDTWIRSLDYAGTGVVNMFKTNTSDQIEMGGNLQVDSFEFPEDTGASVFCDMPVSATPTAGDEMSYAMRVDGDNILTVYAEADSAGSIQNKGIKINNIYEFADSVSVDDDDEIVIKTGVSGFGEAMAGDNEEWVHFRFTSAGVVTLIDNSTNVANTDSDTDLCVYDAGSGIAIKNRLGATKTIKYKIYAS